MFKAVEEFLKSFDVKEKKLNCGIVDELVIPRSPAGHRWKSIFKNKQFLHQIERPTGQWTWNNLLTEKVLLLLDGDRMGSGIYINDTSGKSAFKSSNINQFRAQLIR